MELLFAHDHRFSRAPDGEVLTDNENGSGYPFFQRYLGVFDRVSVIGRIGEATCRRGYNVTGAGVGFLPLPFFHGPSQYLRQYFPLRKRLEEIVASKAGAAFIVRSPGTISSMLIGILKRRGIPFGMEVVSDPYDVFAPGAIRTPLRPLFRRWFAAMLRGQCADADVISYVTERVLQARYPAVRAIFTTHYSSICLGDEAYVEAPRTITGKQRHVLVSVGTMDQMYKAQDVLVESVGHCIRQGLDLRLALVGDGILRGYLQRKVASLDLQERVIFVGRLPSGMAVREQLDAADLFVLPSKGEGLPRAMIEAMARALPCLGSTASGIPELLPADDLVPPGDSLALAAKIRDVLAAPDRMTGMSARNLERSKSYRNELLQGRRVEFYQKVKEITQAHRSAEALPCPR
ncbi:MAG: glycosyltransferase [Desulfuromonadales bacterium]|nr:glycosyltransferase [Desulfuromonadales bacterium]